MAVTIGGDVGHAALKKDQMTDHVSSRARPAKAIMVTLSFNVSAKTQQKTITTKVTAVIHMTRQMNSEGFANCTNIGECEAACPKEIKMEVIARTNRDYIKAVFLERPEFSPAGAEQEKD
jgi:ferredoxin